MASTGQPTSAEVPNAASTPGPRPLPTLSRAPSVSGASRFVETPMHEYTPAHSLYEADEDGQYDDYLDDEDADLTNLRIVLRAVNALLHFVACLLLLIIMALFLDYTRHHRPRFRHTKPQAIVLVVLLSLDLLLDIASLIRAARRHPIWAVVVRLVLGIGYLALFMVYVGLGNVFPHRYAFWGLSPGFAGPVVYLFLWMIGVWNLLNTALHRHRVGQGVRAAGAAVRQCFSGRRQSNSPRGGGAARAARSFWSRRPRQQGAPPQQQTQPQYQLDYRRQQLQRQIVDVDVVDDAERGATPARDAHSSATTSTADNKADDKASTTTTTTTVVA